MYEATNNQQRDSAAQQQKRMRCYHFMTVSKYRKRRADKYQRRAARLAEMRAAKERKRLENPPEHEPKMEPWHRFEIGVRDKLNGPLSYGEAWTDFVSLRDAVRRLKVIRENCLNTP